MKVSKFSLDEHWISKDLEVIKFTSSFSGVDYGVFFGDSEDTPNRARLLDWADVSQLSSISAANVDVLENLAAGLGFTFTLCHLIVCLLTEARILQIPYMYF